MAVIEFDIGSGLDYDSVTLWNADLDDSGLYNSGDDAQGNIFAEAFNEKTTINLGDTIGLNSILLIPEVGEEHDGTAGTGPRLNVNAFGYRLITDGIVPVTVQGIEADGVSANNSGGFHLLGNVATVLRQCLAHDFVGTGGSRNGIKPGCPSEVMNSIVYNHSGKAGIDNVSNFVQQLLSSTVFNTGGDNIESANAGATATLRNNLSCNAGSNDIDDSNWDTTETNMTSDASSPQTGLRNVVTADQFVSTVGGSEDLKLKLGADAIGAGADRGTTPTGVNFDILGFDRDAGGVTWDIGAHQFRPAAGGAQVWPSPTKQMAHLINR